MRFAGLFLPFLLLGCGPPSDQPVLGTVFQVEGGVTIGGKTDSSKNRPCARGDTIAAGDQIRVGRQSITVLSLTSGIYLRCFEGTHIGIGALTISKDGDETANAMSSRKVAVQVEGGRIDFFLPAASPSRTILRIDSSRGALSAESGSLFSITFKNDSMRVLCARGEVNLSEAHSASTTIGAGYFWDSRSDPQAGREPSSAADAAAAQEEIMTLLDSAQAIIDLEDAARNAPAPWRR